VRRPPSGLRGSRDKGADLVWSAALVVTSVVGGLAAADITHESMGWALAVSLVVAAIGVVALYRGLLDDTGPAYGQHAGPPAGQSVPAGQAPHAAQPLPAGPGYDPAAGGARQEPVRPGLVQVVRQPGAPAWWDQQSPVPAAGRAAAPPRPVDLSRFLGQALVAQCPHCGSFHVDFDNRAEPWAFWCHECRQQWAWQPGTPWPPIAVRPRARGRMRTPGA